jgi:hypothetical protein
MKKMLLELRVKMTKAIKLALKSNMK